MKYEIRYNTARYQTASFHGAELLASYNELKGVLGKPSWTDSCEEKTTCEWSMEYVETEGETIKISPFTVYDYREHRVWDNDEKLHWHIGGTNAENTLIVRDYIKKLIDEKKNVEKIFA